MTWRNRTWVKKVNVSPQHWGWFWSPLGSPWWAARGSVPHLVAFSAHPVAKWRKLEWWCRQRAFAAWFSHPLPCASLASHKAWVTLPNLGLLVYHRMATVTTKHRQKPQEELRLHQGAPWLPLGWASQIALELDQPHPWLCSQLDIEGVVSPLPNIRAGDPQLVLEETLGSPLSAWRLLEVRGLAAQSGDPQWLDTKNLSPPPPQQTYWTDCIFARSPGAMSTHNALRNSGIQDYASLLKQFWCLHPKLDLLYQNPWRCARVIVMCSQGQIHSNIWRLSKIQTYPSHF